MPTEPKLSIEEIRTIIHGLKMSGLSFIEEGAKEEIQAMINALPSSEMIDKLAQTPASIKHLLRDVGNIMKIIEMYGKRDIEYKTRYKSRTGLPPRYKVLDWKKSFNLKKYLSKKS